MDLQKLIKNPLNNFCLVDNENWTRKDFLQQEGSHSMMLTLDYNYMQPVSSLFGRVKIKGRGGKIYQISESHITNPPL